MSEVCLYWSISAEKRESTLKVEKNNPLEERVSSEVSLTLEIISYKRLLRKDVNLQEQI